MNFYIKMLGGIGDILLYMMKPGSPFGYFPALKARGDTTMVEALANSDAASELFDGQPCVDHIRFRGFSKKIDTAPGEDFNLLKNYRDLVWAQPQLFLDDEEQETLAELKKAPYIAVHLGSSNPARTPPGIEALIDGLTKANVRAVFVGAEVSDNEKGITGNRTPGFRRLLDSHIWLPPRLRLQVAAVQSARKFIGTVSCFNCAAQLAAVPSFILYNRAYQDPGIFGMMNANRAVMRPWNAGVQPINTLYRDAVEWAQQ